MLCCHLSGEVEEDDVAAHQLSEQGSSDSFLSFTAHSMHTHLICNGVLLKLGHTVF